MEELIMGLITLAGKYPVGAYVIVGLGMLGVLKEAAESIILLTPTKRDDAWLVKFKSGTVVGAVCRMLSKLKPKK